MCNIDRAKMQFSDHHPVCNQAWPNYILAHDHPFQNPEELCEFLQVIHHEPFLEQCSQVFERFPEDVGSDATTTWPLETDLAIRDRLKVLSCRTLKYLLESDIPFRKNFFLYDQFCS